MNRLNKQNASVYPAIIIGLLNSKLVWENPFQLVNSFGTFGNDVFLGDDSRFLQHNLGEAAPHHLATLLVGKSLVRIIHSNNAHSIC